MKKFLTTLVASVMALAPTGALAGNTNIEEHQHLWDTLGDIGITPLVNNPRYCKENVMGLYSSSGGFLVVCQQLAKYNNNRMVDWTPEDMDTLRHEAHHVVQDCLSRRMGDGRLGNMFDGRGELSKFTTGVLSDSQVNWIIDSYSEKGATAHIIKLEIEAFAVAAAVGPLPIAQALVNNCTR